ncbi:MAG: class I SAM-dependent methyltransferase [Aliidiomarina sp.]|uniref:class I SAM-dependent methyltransferase n=1 Tax=Aliidiomarina sp. TaxID=1872439 RepID=UPI0025C4FFE9|nr:class I SAM-dependent methyltransferase [Aliidiomarina sp.]MCH8501173.1 class I SAM-dependent methyltransferase [Aliidiomarina sp.]
MNPWDERYSKDDYHYGTQPNDFLKANATTLLSDQNSPQVLCLADGEGRNSVYLAELGAQATAVDISLVGLEKAKQLAAQRKVSLTTLHADLSTHRFPSNTYDAVVMIFCHMPSASRPFLYEQIKNTLKPGGRLLVECYNEAQLGRGTGGPPVADLMLSLEELKHEFSAFDVQHALDVVRPIHEGQGHTGEGSVCQFIAVKPDAG